MNAPANLCFYVFGAGGAGREVAWVARESLGPEATIRHLVDAPEFLDAARPGTDIALLDALPAGSGAPFVVALGEPLLREQFADACESRGLRPVSLLHPGVALSPRTWFGEGSIVCAGSILTVDIRIGRHVYVNVGCTLSHDVTVGDFSTLSPGVRICGHVSIGRSVFVGAGATVINGTPDRPLCIGDGATIAAGACVIGSVEPGTTVAGVPAKLLRRRP